MKFLLSHVFKTISKNIKINAIIVLTLFVAYLFFFLGCCYIEDGVRDMESFQQKQMDDSIRFESGAGFSEMNATSKISDEEFNALFERYDFVKETTVVEKNYMDDPLSGEAFSYNLISPNYADFFFVNVLDGRFFTADELETGANVCVVEKAFQDRKDVNIGGFITLDGAELQIVGVVKRNADSGKVFIPARTMKNDAARDQHFQGYEVAAVLSDQERRFDMQWDQLGLAGEFTTAREHYVNGLQFLFRRSIPIFILCAVLLCYALLNLINIMTGKLESQKRSLGIRLAVGASYRQIFLQFFFECLVLILIAVGAIFLLEPVINALIKTRFNHYFGVMSVVAMLGASVVSSFFISRILIRKLKKMDVITIIKNL